MHPLPILSSAAISTRGEEKHCKGIVSFGMYAHVCVCVIVLICFDDVFNVIGFGN